MAKKVGLSFYGLSVVDGSNKLELHNILQGKSFLDLLFEYIDFQKNKLTDDKNNESVFSFDEVAMDDVFAEDGKKEGRCRVTAPQRPRVSIHIPSIFQPN